jgi:hypothetical protein
MRLGAFGRFFFTEGSSASCRHETLAGSWSVFGTTESIVIHESAALAMKYLQI